MTPILATDYGNLYALSIGAPALLLALLLFAFGAGFRQRGLHGIASVIALLAGIRLFTSLPDAKHGDVQLTNILGWSAVVLAGIALLAAIVTRPRPAPTANDESKSHKVA